MVELTERSLETSSTQSIYVCLLLICFFKETTPPENDLGIR